MSRSAIAAIFVALFTLSSLGCTSARRIPEYMDSSMDRPREYLRTSRGFLERHLERDELVKVKPWEREILAQDDMSWEPDKMQSLRRSHIHFSKEASLGGGSAGGGGCGCN